MRPLIKQGDSGVLQRNRIRRRADTEANALAFCLYPIISKEQLPLPPQRLDVGCDTRTTEKHL